MTTPKHVYETVEGTPAVAHGVHDPRTVAHTVVADDADLHMMTEIGDGVFVQWSTCRRCAERVADCTCKEGPQEPTYMKAWRDQRFARDLNTRPEPSYEILPSVIAWLEERGYDVTKSVKKQLAEAKPFDPDDPPAIELTDKEREELAELPVGTVRCRTCSEPYSEYGDGWDGECPDCADRTWAAEESQRTYRGKPVEDVHLPDDDEVDSSEEVDAGLDAALSKVREARDTSNIDVDF